MLHFIVHWLGWTAVGIMCVVDAIAFTMFVLHDLAREVLGESILDKLLYRRKKCGKSNADCTASSVPGTPIPAEDSAERSQPLPRSTIVHVSGRIRG